MSALVRIEVNGRAVEVPAGASVAAAVASVAPHFRRSRSGQPRAPLCGMFFDRRVDAGIDFDGRLSTTYGPPQDLPYGPTRATRFGLDRPFLLVGAQGHTHLNPEDPSWPQFWGNQRGWKRDAHLPLGVHFTFSDFPAILPPLGDAVPAGFAAGAYGTLPAAEAVAGTRAYVRAFFDLHLKGRPTRLFDAGSPAYPNFQPVP